jgi:hypothetical protein
MAFNINDMISTVNSVGGLTKASKFLVRITPPSTIKGDRVFEFLCESATLPGLSYQTDELRMAGYGNVNKVPYAPIFQDVPLSFYCDSDGRVLKFFHTWMQSIFNWNEGTPPQGSSSTGLASNSLAYPKEYFGIVEIIHYDDTGNLATKSNSSNLMNKERSSVSKQPGSSKNPAPAKEQGIIKYTLNEAYPISIGDVQMAWGMDDTLVRIPVTFSYKYWNSQTLDQGTVNSRSSARSNAVNYTQTRVDQNVNDVREILNITSPIYIQRQVNIFSALLSLF